MKIFLIFLRLGLTSFGGPVAHLGYFRREFVTRRRWIDEASYADLLALCQFLPGPASSQAGFAIGLSRKGIGGGLAAWAGFTLPSALALFLFALFAGSWTGRMAEAFLHGLKLVAVAVVAQAVWGMAQSLTPDLRRAAIALVALLVVIFLAGAAGQLGAILIGGVLGLALCRQPGAVASGRLSFAVSRGLGVLSLLLFACLLAGLPLAARLVHAPGFVLFEAFYRSGALVFGGGHVVLPLLKTALVDTGLVSLSSFLSGYGAAQAVPGPLFAVSAYLGAVAHGMPNAVSGALIALLGIFLPGFLILLGTLPFWDAFRKREGAQALMRGVNAAIVGFLAAALYNPIWTGAVLDMKDAGLAGCGFLLLTFGKFPSWSIVAGMTGAAMGLALLA